jgi:hypothetical protein
VRSEKLRESDGGVMLALFSNVALREATSNQCLLRVSDVRGSEKIH